MNKIILCFDGTGNEPEDSIQDITFAGHVEDASISNVLKLHLILGGCCRTRVDPGEQMSFYYSGVGTYGNWIHRLRNKFRAPENEDVGTIIRRAIGDLAKHYQSGDQVFVFGFSRGAAIARRFCSVLSETWPALREEETPKIRLMGVFDTVAALNLPNLMQEEIRPASDVVFENRTVSPLVEEAIHMVSLDERRIAFRPTLMNKDKRVTEVWFAGAHSDVGGGFHYDGLSDITLQFLLDRLLLVGLKLTPPLDIGYADLFEEREKDTIDYQDVVIHPNHLGRSHVQEAITTIKEKFLHHRSPCILVNDKESVFPPLIHYSVIERMHDDPTYIPYSLSNNMFNRYTGERISFRVWFDSERQEVFGSITDPQLMEPFKQQRLQVGTSKTFWVFANQKFTPSRILMKQGEVYRFTVKPQQLWFDANILANACGWIEENEAQLKWYKKLIIGWAEDDRRHPSAKWFEMLGTVGRSEDGIIRVTQASVNPWTCPRDGEFYAFPNDLPGKYGNNLGAVELTVTREADHP